MTNKEIKEMNFSDNAKYSLVMACAISEAVDNGVDTDEKMKAFLHSEFGLSVIKRYWDMM